MRRSAATRPGPRIPRARERGFALLIVLWTTSLLALIGAQITSAGRTEAKLAGNLRGSAIAEAAADAAIQDVAMRLMRPGGAAMAGGAPAFVRLPQAAVEVAVESESRKLPINTAPLPTMIALLRMAGADERAAIVVGTQIADWRSPANFPLKNGAKAPQYRAAGRDYGPSNRPFRTLADLAMVLDMTPALLARLAPHVSVYTQSSPKPADGDPLVLAAMRNVSANGVQPLVFDEAPVYRLNALARASGGGQFIRRAVIRLNTVSDASDPTRAIDILSWSEGVAGTLPD